MLLLTTATASWSSGQVSHGFSEVCKPGKRWVHAKPHQAPKLHISFSFSQKQNILESFSLDEKTKTRLFHFSAQSGLSEPNFVFVFIIYFLLPLVAFASVSRGPNSQCLATRHITLIHGYHEAYKMTGAPASLLVPWSSIDSERGLPSIFPRRFGPGAVRTRT